MAPFKIDKKQVADAIVGAVVFAVESVVRLIFSIPSLLSGRRESVPVFKIDDKKKKPVVIACLFTIVVSLGSMLLVQWDRPPADDYTAQHALGEGMAEETCKLLGNKGQIVVVRMEGQGRKLPNGEAQMKTFLNALSKRGGVTLAGTEVLTVSFSPSSSTPPQTFSAETLSSILETYPNVSGIVSFVGAPLLSDDEIAKLDLKLPKIIVFDNMRPDLKKLLDEGVVQLAIVHRPKARSEFEKKKKPKSLKACFDQLYEVVKSEAVPTQPPREQPTAP